MIMATNDQKAPKNDGSRSLKAHKEPERLAAHPEQARLKAYEEEEIVPAVTADVDETPKVIKYGAAVLLGLAFGLGCYIWVDGGFPSNPRILRDRLRERRTTITSIAPTIMLSIIPTQISLHLSRPPATLRFPK